MAQQLLAGRKLNKKLLVCGETYTAPQLEEMNDWWISQTNTQWPTLKTRTLKGTPTKKFRTVWESLTKQEVVTLRSRMARKVRQLKKLPNNNMGDCFHCFQNNCPYFRGLKDMPIKLQTKFLLNRIKYHHPLYSCQSLRICPQEAISGA